MQTTKANSSTNSANYSNSFSENRVVNYVTVTDAAAKEIDTLLRAKTVSAEGEIVGIKVALRTKGCSGLSYKIEYAKIGKNISKYDDVMLLQSGSAIFFDPKASLFIIGTTMDYRKDKFKSGFEFINPNEKGRCGCGESFYV